jgi:hypothetical protein
VKDGFSFTLRPDFDYKAKRYPNKTSQDYNQIRCDLPVILKQESDWTIEVITGINSYEYLNAVKDEFKTKCGIDVKKQFLDGAFDVEAFYTYRYVHREKIADRIERLCGGSAKAKLECPLVKRVEMGLTEGSDNTKTEEEREDSYDYKFLNWYAKAEYGFAAGAVDGFTRYTRLNRVYADFNHDFNGYTLNNSLSYKFFEQGASSSKLKLEYFHKQIRFPYVSSLHLYNNNIVSEMVFTRKDDWKASSAFETRFYKFPFRRTNDKIYYIVKFYAEKRLLKKDLTAGFEYKYTYKNFLHKSAITESAYKLNVTLKF